MSKNYGNDSQIAEIVKYISDTMKLPLIGAGGGFAPIGTINSYMGSVAPQGWLVCDGTVYNIADYPDLATHIASQFGSTNFFGGNGTTTFAVPDLRGEFLRGSGTNSHTNQGSGANVGVHQDGTELPYIRNLVSSYTLAQYRSVNVNSDVSPLNMDSEINIGDGFLNTTGTKGSDTTSTFLPETYTSRPTNTSVLFIIKATVSGDANAHQYSTEEQVVGMTEDGEVLYEKTITGLSVSMAGDTFTVIPSFSISANNISVVREAKGINTAKEISFPLIAYKDGNTLKVMISRPSNSTTILGTLIIQYTKTQ